MTKTTKKVKPVTRLQPTPGAEAWDEPTSTVEAGTKIAGSALVPPDVKAIATRVYYYWLGVTSDCPSSHIDAGDVKFPRMEALLEPNPAGGRDLRRPVVGKIQALTEKNIRSVIDELPRLIMRLFPKRKNPGEVTGYAVTIPTEKQIKEARSLGRPSPAYDAQDGDVPAANFMFAVLCPDQDSPTRGHHYPPPISEIGLEWPDELEQ